MEKQREFYEKILDVTKAQKECLENEKLEEFEALIDVRGELIEEFSKMGDVVKNDENLNKMRDEIVEIHAQNIQNYEVLRDAVKGKLRTLRAQKQFGGVYANPYNSLAEEGVFFDKRHKF